MDKTQLFDIIVNFDIDGIPIDVEACSGGHINKTFNVTFQMNSGEIKHYILQYVNEKVFHNIEGIMENIKKVTEHIKTVVLEQGGDPAKETIHLIDLKSNPTTLPLYDNNWRMEEFIENTIAMTATEKLNILYESGKIVGKFQNMLSNFNHPEELCEIIPDFHNTPIRYENFEKAVQDAKMQRKDRYKNAQIQEDKGTNSFDYIHYIVERKSKCDAITSKLENAGIPTRVTHNDTKLANVLFDADTEKAVCLIDLDTIMPGSLLYDFGEGVRTGITTAEEDEQDTKKVKISLARFEAYTMGFLEGIGDEITQIELEMLVDGAYMMTFENGMRFLTDDLNGDVYYEINPNIPHHNLVRARVQFEVLSQMEQEREKMQEIVKTCASQIGIGLKI